jgi:pantoate--beta-alanine ligase
MALFYTVDTLQRPLLKARAEGQSIGFVPTMGALHSGHLSLVRKALEENDLVVVSIFVNPTQFDKEDDLQKYPAQLEEDVKLIEEIASDILVFAPTAKEVYPQKMEAKQYNFEGLEKVMEGEFRTGHFDGVGTVVERLFEICIPHRAYFGEKDFQQLQIIRKLVDLQGIDIDIVGCPIEREDHGLARSSRNERLSLTAREKAGMIYAILKAVRDQFDQKNAEELNQWVIQQFQEEESLELEYFEIADAHTLTPLMKRQTGQKYRAFIAVYSEGVRLIDNIALN